MPDVIYMKKKELLKKLNRNLQLHKQIYKETRESFKKNYIKRLNIMLDTVKKENKFIMQLELIQPENHEDAYIRAINMVKMNCRNEIALREDEFNEYILNRWDWIKSFRYSYLSNSSSSSASSSSSRTSKAVECYFAGTE